LHRRHLHLGHLHRRRACAHAIDQAVGDGLGTFHEHFKIVFEEKRPARLVFEQTARGFAGCLELDDRKFGALGFNIPYEFSQADLSACIQFIQNHITDVDSKKRPVDWPTVNYMVCAVQYGGKITDGFDQHLFNTYGQAWLASRVMENGFEFFKGYKVPSGQDIEVYRKYIYGLPLVDNPEIFGLHTNADLVYRTQLTSNVLETILDISPKDSGGGGGESREDLVLRIVNDLESKMPPDYKMEEVKVTIKAMGAQKPLNICLQQEIDQHQSVLSVVRKTLSNLKLAIAGTIVMSSDLEAAVNAMALARVPPLWTKRSQLDLPTLGTWFGAVVQPRQAVHRLAQGRASQCLLAHRLLQPAGLPDRQPSGGVPQALQGGLGARRRCQPDQGRQHGEG
jgi:dynein heavy chain